MHGTGTSLGSEWRMIGPCFLQIYYYCYRYYLISCQKENNRQVQKQTLTCCW